ncbi:hypothetical protein [Nocardioides sp. L-11A]|uniref:hypothetical protein n=1 Tax=Nocardioides sp. L-11A TaxID=3043848 RepID=UPI002499C085|nr:hypothetical protein QJ852_02980 [Nocardioides sp. L-11A]
MTLHRDPGPGAGPVALRAPSRHALLLTAWLVACAVGVSAAIDGARAFDPPGPPPAAAERPGAGDPAVEDPGAGEPEPTARPEGPTAPADVLADAERRWRAAWAAYVATLRGPGARTPPPVAIPGPGTRGGPGGGRAPEPGPATGPTGASGAETPAVSALTGQPAAPPPVVPEPVRPEPVAPVPPGPGAEPPGPPSGGLLTLVSGLIEDVLGLLR